MMNRKFGHVAILMAAAEAAVSAGGTATAPDTNVAEAEKKTRAPKNPDNILNIINGRMPFPLVALIRRKALGEKSTAEYAKAFGTSVGKVFDIAKGRNFGYIDASYKPSAEEVEASKKWCTEMKTAKGQLLKEAGGDPDAILKALGEMGVATAEEVAARNWQVRQVGQKKAAGEAPVAETGGDAKASSGAAAPAAGGGAKLF